MAYKPVRKSGTITTSTGTVVLGLGGEAVAVVYLSGTYTGLSGVFEGSIDGTNYFTVQAYDVGTGKQLTGATSLSAANKAVFIFVTGLTHLRFRATALSTGSVLVTIVNSQSTPPVDPVNTIQYTTSAGTTATGLAAGSGNANVVIYVGTGILHRLIVTTAGTASLILYDNATTNSGTILYSSAATYALGTVTEINVPFANGITARQASGTAAVTVVYTPLS